MLVIFYNSTNTKIENFRQLPFAEAVVLSENVERECRVEKLKFNAEFQVTDINGKTYYKGVFSFGSYDFQNIYHQLRELAPKIKLSKDGERDRQYLLEEIEQLTPAAYKKIELVDKTFINLEKTNISKLKKWQRLIFYILAPSSVLGVLVLSSMLLSQQTTFEAELIAEKERGAFNTQLIEEYEFALKGDKSSLKVLLEKLYVDGKLSENQEVLLINEYLIASEYEKAIQINEDTIYIETLLLSNKHLTDSEKAKKIAAFNELYPTNEARFDLAYFEKNYSLMLNVENVNMTVQRSEMKTYAHLKLDQIEEAKTELNNNSNTLLSEKIIRYEILIAEIKTLKERLTLVAGVEKDEIQAQINSKEEEISKL